MHLALTNDLHVNGGAVSLMAHRYVRALNDAGHATSLITGRGNDALPNDIPVISWEYPKREGGLLGSLRLAKEIRQRSGGAFREWMTSVRSRGAEPSGWLAMVIPSADGAMRAGGRALPLLYLCNSPWAMEWDAAYESQHGYRAPTLKRLLALWPRRRMERGVVSRATRWTALSQLQLDWFSSEHPGCAQVPKKVISGAVVCSDYTPLTSVQRRQVIESEGFDPQLPMILCSRRLVPRTGVDMLIDAHADMTCESTLVITGGGPEAERLAAQAAVSPRSGRIHLLGFVDRERLRRLTAAATVAVLPTRALEGFGLSAAEAFASGTPVVATPVAALVGVVGGLDRRLLTGNVSAGALSEALYRVLSEDELHGEAFRWKCRNYAETHFDWGKLKGDFVKLVEATCERRPT